MKKVKLCPNCGRKFKGSRKYCCYGCSVNAISEANRQLKEKEGPIYDKWKNRLKASIQ